MIKNDKIDIGGIDYGFRKSRIGSICKWNKWVEATELDDTYKEKCSKDGAIVDGKVFPENKYDKKVHEEISMNVVANLSKLLTTCWSRSFILSSRLLMAYSNPDLMMVYMASSRLGESG